MSPKDKRITRRHVLKGIGGATLALPFLPSLFKGKDDARAAGIVKKRYVHFMTQHGAVWGNESMYPAASTLTNKMSYAGRTVQSGPLTRAVNGANAGFSPTLQGTSGAFTASIASKMNVIRGVDIPFYIGHHTGGHMGNFARNDGNGSDGVLMQKFPTTTIDQIMAWSQNFYADLTTVLSRSISMGGRVSYGYANPMAKTGSVQELSSSLDAVALFKQIFMPFAGPQQTLDTPIVDLVLADYQRLRNGNTRLSANDKSRLDDHMQRVSELQREVGVKLTCGVSPVTTDTNSLINQSTYSVSPTMQATVYDTLNSVIAAGIICDSCRIASVNINDTFSTYPTGNWHQSIAHEANLLSPGTAQATMQAAANATFQATFLDLCNKLDVDDGTGKTYLDNSLVVWTSEHGEYTHDGQGMPVITAGSAGGFLNTGLYCDYRDQNIVIDGGTAGTTPTDVKVYGGLLWQQWLGTALQAMGVQPAEYASSTGLLGYPNAYKFVGTFFSNQPTTYFYPDALWSAAGDILPFLKAG